MTQHTNIAGVILAGGLARRMGGQGNNDKALLPLGGKPILSHVIDRLCPQASPVIINANGDPDRFLRFGLPVVADTIDGFAGPLAGVLSGLDWAASNAPDAKWVVSIACDTPFFPVDLVARMIRKAETDQADLVCAASGGRRHPVFGLWPVNLRNDLRDALVGEKIRKVDIWTARHKLTVAEFGTMPHDPFFNANRPDDLAEAERLLREMGA